MFGIGGGEFIFIILIVLMFFGSDKIPEMARTLGKGMAQLKNATNDIKNEIHNSAKDNGIDINALTGGISEEINKAKQGFAKMVEESAEGIGIKSEIEGIKSNLGQAAGPGLPTPDIAAENNPATHDGPVKRQS